ncbi:opsin-5-like [Acipenser oxyrinchus oxyrinchus]|uniref:Opsin-5-like n=1 Tax=Acipenser oxyrinchus oxyrinchus TaxID=40147 RepID=A0AAD8FWU2_ACIOX|nr:opsin-5-like [Acipenser oxyrinchus oxyrinchus]
MRNASETALFVSTMSRENDVIMGTIYSVFGVLSLLGNCVLLFVAYRKKSSLKPAEFFIINLSLSDLGMTLTLFPLAIPSAFSHRWLFDDVACQYYAFCGVLFGLCSLTNLTVLSSVCCLKVCYPSYGNKFSSAHACLLVAGVWCYALIFAGAPLAKWGHYGPEPYGTACCINWQAPNSELSAMTYIVSLFAFCYVVPCTIIFTSYTFILLTVRGSRQAVQQHISPQTKTSNTHKLIIKLSIAVCIGFLMAWSPYAVVAMWAAFGDATRVPPMAFAIAAILAKSSTLYNPVVYLLFKPNFRKFLCRDAAHCRRCLCAQLCCCKRPVVQKEALRNKEFSNSTRLSNGLPESHTTCRHWPDTRLKAAPSLHRTARVLTTATHSEVPVTQLTYELQKEIL